MSADPLADLGRVAVLGAGRLGETLVAGLLRAGAAPGDLVAGVRRPERAAELTQRYGVVAAPAAEVARGAGVVVLVVKPQDVAALLAEVAPALPVGALVLSLAAGVSTAAVESPLRPGTPVVRAMTNTPALVGEAMSVISAGAAAGEEHLERVEALLRPLGRVLRLPEKHLDAVTALSGSGPAYFFYVVEALVDAGVLLGLPRAAAVELVAQTAVGAAAMVREGGQTPAQLREGVTSPAGTTAHGLRELDRSGVRTALVDAVEAAAVRSRELGGPAS